MKNSKRTWGLIILTVVLVLAVSFTFAEIHNSKTFATENQEVATIDSLFSGKEVESTGYLYNYDDSIDYIYIDFKDSNGYVILIEETSEILEYSLSGDFPYDLAIENKYYGGPNAYFTKNGNTFINILTNNKIEFSESTLKKEADNIRASFSIQQKSLAENYQLLKNQSNKLQLVTEQLCSNNKSTKALNANKSSLDYPPLDEKNLISPTNGAHYISNSEYFLTQGASPRHGNNIAGTCTTVAIQLLLSYNNYYNDRRIIADQYLFGNEEVNPERNPNYCVDPNTKTSYTLGSTQEFHNMLVDSYNIKGNFYTSSNGLQAYLNDRNIDCQVNYTYTDTASGSLNQDIVMGELLNGRPIVLETTSRLNGTPYDGQREINHAVIAYGYQTFAAYANKENPTLYSGYIVHFGWDPNGIGNKINVWTNASWFNNSISLNINHTHEYSKTGQVCNCKHRKAYYQSKEIFTDFGYEGSTYSWKGSVEMEYDLNNRFDSSGFLVVRNGSPLIFKVRTISSLNSWLVTNGEIKFELQNAKGEIEKTHICNVKVSLSNNVTFEGDTFSILPYEMDAGIYILKMTSKFTRGTWSVESTDSYTLGINEPITVMRGFGFNSLFGYWNGKVTLTSEKLFLFNSTSPLTIMGEADLNFEIGTENAMCPGTNLSGTVTVTLKDSSNNILPINGNSSHTSYIQVASLAKVSISNSTFSINVSDFADGTYTLALDCVSGTQKNSATFTFVVKNEMCISQGTMITLADKTQKAVEDLTGNEELLVWNMLTGEFDSAPILFIDNDKIQPSEIISLYFSDGTLVNVIGEHAFWDIYLNKYVFFK